MWILSVCLNNNSVLAAFMSDHWVCDTSNKRDVASETGTIYPSGSPSSLCRIRIAQSFTFCVVFYKSLFVICPFSFGHYTYFPVELISTS